MTEGDLVVIIGKLDTRIKDRQNENLTIGTFQGYITNKKVMVLLADGDIFIGNEHEIVSNETQVKTTQDQL